MTVPEETGLEKLTVNDKNIIKNHSNEYEITVSGSVEEIDVSAIPKSDKSKVTIIGNNNLKEGENEVIVNVEDENAL